MLPSSTAMTALVQRWYDAANQSALPSQEQVQQLSDETEAAAAFLQEIKDSEQPIMKEKIAGLTASFLQAFSTHDPEESKRLVEWAIKYSVSENEGTVAPLHHLLQALQAARKDPRDQSRLASIDSAFLEYLAVHKTEASEGSAAPDVLNTSMGSRSLQQLLTQRTYSKEQKAQIDTELIDLLNKGQLELEKLNLFSIKEIEDFFGKEKCAEIKIIELKEPWDYTDTGAYIDTEALFNTFPNLTSCILKFNRTIEEAPIQFNVASQKMALENVELEAPGTVIDLQFVPHCPNLKSIKIFSDSVNHINDLQHCTNLEHVDIHLLKGYNPSTQQITNLDFLQPCTKLQELFLTGFFFVDSCAALEGLTQLERVRFEDLLAASSFPLDQAPLEQVEIHNCPNIFNFDFLGEPLQVFILSTDPRNMTTEVPLTDLSFLQKCPNLKRLEIKGLSTHIEDLSVLKHCPKLERFVFTASHRVQDFSVCLNLPSLKKFDPGRLKDKESEQQVQEIREAIKKRT
jgi:hypothetical protein